MAVNSEPMPRGGLFVKGLGIGVINGVLLSLIMVPLFRAGIAPLPQPPSLAFGEAIAGRSLPLPVGLLLHLVYVAVWSGLFVALAYPRATFARALALGVALWVLALVVFFPINGWGLLGLEIGPQAIVASLVPHLLFAFFLWALARWTFGAPGRA